MKILQKHLPLFVGQESRRGITSCHINVETVKVLLANRITEFNLDKYIVVFLFSFPDKQPRFYYPETFPG